MFAVIHGFLFYFLYMTTKTKLTKKDLHMVPKILKNYSKLELSAWRKPTTDDEKVHLGAAYAFVKEQTIEALRIILYKKPDVNIPDGLIIDSKDNRFNPLDVFIKIVHPIYETLKGS